MSELHGVCIMQGKKMAKKKTLLQLLALALACCTHGETVPGTRVTSDAQFKAAVQGEERVVMVYCDMMDVLQYVVYC